MVETFTVEVWTYDKVMSETFHDVTDARTVEGFLRIVQSNDVTTSLNTKDVQRTKSFTPEEEPF